MKNVETSVIGLVSILSGLVTTLAYGGVTLQDIFEFLTSLLGLVVLSSASLATLLVKLLMRRSTPVAPPPAMPVASAAPPEVVLLRKTTTRERSFLGIVATKTTEMIEELAPSKVISLLLVSVSAIAVVSSSLFDQHYAGQRNTREPTHDPVSVIQRPPPPRGVDLLPPEMKPEMKPEMDESAPAPNSPMGTPPPPPGVDDEGVNGVEGENDNSASGFTISVQGVITGVAALVTAITGGYWVWRTARK